MNFDDLKSLYEKYKAKYGSDAYRHISELLREAKQIHYRDWLQKPTKNRDHEQSWRAFKGKNLEKLILHIMKDEVETLGLKIVEGNKLERTNSNNLSAILSLVRRSLLVRFGDEGQYGFHLPDVDLIIYKPNTADVVAVVSSKVTLRERIAQTGYWKIKLLEDPVTRRVKVFFITPDEDGTLTSSKPMKKGRAIVEVDTDGSYVMTEETVEESSKVKAFDKFIEDLKKLT